jgi:hypothetical protein
MDDHIVIKLPFKWWVRVALHLIKHSKKKIEYRQVCYCQTMILIDVVGVLVGNLFISSKGHDYTHGWRMIPQIINLVYRSTWFPSSSMSYLASYHDYATTMHNNLMILQDKRNMEVTQHTHDLGMMLKCNTMIVILIWTICIPRMLYLFHHWNNIAWY